MAKKQMTIGLDIQMAGGKNKTKKADRPVIDSPTRTEGTGKTKKTILIVDECISISQQIENLVGELKLLETNIIDAAKTEKKKQEDGGNFVKTVDVKGTELKIQIQFRDAYSKMAITMREPLKEIFGSAKYAVMFTEEKITTLRPEKIAELKEILGARYADFVTVDESVKPSKEFQATHFAMRDQLKPEQQSTVQQVLDACQSNPAVKYPK